MSPPGRWTLSILTIPRREAYVTQLLRSLREGGLPRGIDISIVYNWDTRESPAAVERRLQKAAGGLPLQVSFNPGDPTIASGRAQQLGACKTPLVCFVDDDVTIHGELFPLLEETLRNAPLGLAGIPSLVAGTDRLFKPRRATPHVDEGALRFMPVQGMLVAGYRRLLLDIGGFNPRRRFWGEWTELNLRMWRSGFPTAYTMQGAYLRHWDDAPESPTRNKKGREAHILWGIMCTALEYDATAMTEDTDAFWRLVEDRYVAYAFDEAPTPSRILSSLLELAPRLTAEWTRLMDFRAMTRAHPFQFTPFHRITAADVERVSAHARGRIAAYRDEVWPRTQRNRVGGWISRAVRRSR